MMTNSKGIVRRRFHRENDETIEQMSIEQRVNDHQDQCDTVGNVPIAETTTFQRKENTDGTIHRTKP